jgi:hypothetical protein
VRRSSPSLRKYFAPPSGSELSLFTRPVLCAYWPLRIEAREGQHREVVSKALEKLAPSSAHAESSWRQLAARPATVAGTPPHEPTGSSAPSASTDQP